MASKKQTGDKIKINVKVEVEFVKGKAPTQKDLSSALAKSMAAVKFDSKTLAPKKAPAIKAAPPTKTAATVPKKKPAPKKAPVATKAVTKASAPKKEPVMKAVMPKKEPVAKKAAPKKTAASAVKAVMPKMDSGPQKKTASMKAVPAMKAAMPGPKKTQTSAPVYAVQSSFITQSYHAYYGQQVQANPYNSSIYGYNVDNFNYDIFKC